MTVPWATPRRRAHSEVLWGMAHDKEGGFGLLGFRFLDFGLWADLLYWSNYILKLFIISLMFFMLSNIALFVLTVELL